MIKRELNIRETKQDRAHVSCHATMFCFVTMLLIRLLKHNTGTNFLDQSTFPGLVVSWNQVVSATPSKRVRNQCQSPSARDCPACRRQRGQLGHPASGNLEGVQSGIDKKSLDRFDSRHMNVSWSEQFATSRLCRQRVDCDIAHIAVSYEIGGRSPGCGPDISMCRHLVS